MLQDHYSDIQQELDIKTEALKARRQKIRSLEREIADLQSEFQLDRADYLETIRRLEWNLKFYQQLMDKALPVLRRDNRFWDVETIRASSEWVEDCKKWILPEDSMQRIKLPPAINILAADSAPGRLQSNGISSVPNTPMHKEDEESRDENTPEPDCEFLKKRLQSSECMNQIIVDSYFRPKRANELLRSSKKKNNNTTIAALNKTWTDGEIYSTSPNNRGFQKKLKNF